MFDIGASELLVIVIVAILVIGPKDMPKALRHAGRWIGKLRRMSNHFRAGLDEVVRQAEIEEMEDKWAARNKEIMAKYPDGSSPEGGAPENLLPDQPMEPLAAADEVPDADAAAEAAIKRAAPVKAAEHSDEPTLPLDPPPPGKDS
ncbi:Sec-independent protein translocase protein TatB [Qipengyuania citrea]|jgi:sec-independent protein translocase protein TatB|uniref:Sec-independent protein translocase protein TatB n=1 Tax=Qipengyuania citrea TaxID=225971 RepID=UPI001E31DE22|nr:Sec-independent protein translocase protein TatB [Qipengyuania citrea]MCD1590044.1 Sec-independent protein translocase protein TatB [Qipengyuania citrea]MCZ4264829.1 Sec-independent protein translocase protein TatB [Erythrobacter sp. G21629-S1]